MAAQAHQNSGSDRAGVANRAGQSHGIRAMFALAGDDDLAIQTADILAPEGDIAGRCIGLAGITVAVDPTVWCVTGRTTTAIVEVSAENVSGRRRDLRRSKCRGRQEQKSDG